MSRPDKNDEFQVRCSSACTNAGTVALVTSVVALAILPSVSRAISRNAFTDYLDRRLALQSAVAAVEEDPCWATIRGSNPEGPTVSVLAAAECSTPLTTERAPEKAATPGEDPRTPRAPSGVRFISAFDHGIELREAVTALVDQALLDRARRYSNRAMEMIFKWEQLRYKLTTEPTKPGTVVVRVEGGPMTPEYVLTRLTFREVKELAQYELPAFSEMEGIIGNDDQVTLPSLPVRVGVQFGAVIIQAFLLLPLFYFWLFERAAVTSPGFPAPATLFGVFWGSFGSYGLFLFFAAVPAFAATALGIRAWSMTKLPLAIALALIMVCGLIIRLSVLHRPKSWRFSQKRYQ